MKKIRIVSLICALLICLCACNGTQTSNGTQAETQAPTTAGQTEHASVTDAPQTNAQTEDVHTDAPQTNAQTDAEIITEEPADYSDGWVFVPMSEQILASDEDWSVTGSPVYENGYVSCGGAKGFDIAYMNEFSPEDTYRLEFELKTDGTEENALYVGAGIRTDWGVADENNGLWLYFKGNSICIKDKDGKDVCLPLKYSISDSFSRICILSEKAPDAERVLHVFQSNESGSNELLYKLCPTTENGNTAVYAYAWSSGFTEVCEIADLGFDLAFSEGGYIKLWCDGATGTCVKNLALKVI